MNTTQESLVKIDAKRTRDLSPAVSATLAKRGHRKILLHNLLKSINVLVGIGLLAITFIPVLGQVIGSRGKDIASAIAAVILVGDAVIPLLIGSQPPELYLVYAFYADSYATQIDQILLDEPGNQRDVQIGTGRLIELLRHARLNFDDVRVRFPSIDLTAR